ncbi:MAG: alpha/beta hydrolase [Rickettsiaceae bacterium]|nr:alpha/beta hydrolase [Rickettsiaceae bacterium]
MRYHFKLLKLYVLLFLLSNILASCNIVTVDNNPECIGKLYNYEKKLVKGGDFWITTYQKITDRTKPFVFYIEGDGSPFRGKYRISRNPTPTRQVLLKLATMDDRPNIVYVSRPCHYTPKELNPKCKYHQYWTQWRLSDESVAALNQVINKVNNNQRFSLIGYSGGGGIALLIAARNDMVKDIITIAGNLDHVTFTSHHEVTPMVGSLNPIDYALVIKHIPQLHISGGKDKRIPPFIADQYVTASNSRCVKHKMFPKVEHNYGWNKVWPYVLTLPVTCY